VAKCRRNLLLLLHLLGSRPIRSRLCLAICSTYYRTSIKRVRRRVRDDILRESAKQRLETDFETAEWLNTFLIKFWVIYEPVLSASIVASVDQVLSTETPVFLDSLRLSKFTLGTKAPRVEQVKTYPKSQEDIVLMDWRFTFTPNDVSDLTARQLQYKVNPKVVLAVRVGKGVVGKDIPILVEDMSFSGLMRVKIKLMSQFPHVQAVDLSFLERPDFDYVLKPLGGDTFGFDVGNASGVLKVLH
jgi:Ca2+-dependent lipid-binding protein